jgi:hypothetical protein
MPASSPWKNFAKVTIQTRPAPFVGERRVGETKMDEDGFKLFVPRRENHAKCVKLTHVGKARM